MKHNDSSVKNALEEEEFTEPISTVLKWVFYSFL